MEGIRVYVPHDDLIWVPATILSVRANCKVFHVRLQWLGSNELQNIANGRKDALTQAYDQQIQAHSTKTVDLRQPGMPDALPLQNVFASASTESIISSMQRQNECMDVMADRSAVVVEDMCDLFHLHEPSIVYNLRQRFLADNPYTYTGPIVVAVNPYKSIPSLYTKQLQDVYTSNDRSTLPPHVYAISAQAYNKMRLLKEPQSILVSGESGAGKTETVKILMQHLARMDYATNDPSTVAQRAFNIEMILQSNPLLEAFGNATTVKNNNSSRFGKFIQLLFDSEYQLIGATCRHYLLEKSRVIRQAPNERNFHIFYQLWSQKDSKFHWEDNTEFRYLQGTPNSETSDSEHFKLTEEALKTIGLTTAERDDLFEALVGILRLGQLQFVSIKRPFSSEKEVDEESLATPLVDRCDLAGNPHSSADSHQSVELTRCATLLGFTQKMDTFTQHLCNRTLKARQEVYCVPLSPEQAHYHRDALAKELYTRLFQYLVNRVNQSLQSLSLKHSFREINLLDIFGFEALQTNGFEQFCINYANEKLEQKFISDVYKAVEEEYRQEELSWDHIDYQDNQDLLDLLENPMGLLPLLNEECVRPKGSDTSYVSKIHNFHTTNSRMERASPKLSATHFILHHYAQSVTYDASDFVEKNRDGMSTHLTELMGESENALIASLFSGKQTENSNALKIDLLARKSVNFMHETVSTKFKTQLNELMRTISTTRVQYIRCIKPNAAKTAGLFDIKDVIHQLRSVGIVQAIRLTRAAFPNKLTHEKFLLRFVLLRKTRSHVKMAEGIADACKELLIQSIDSKQFAVGKTMIYFGKGVLEALEHQRTIFIHRNARILQRKAREWLLRLARKRCEMGIIRFQAIYRRRRARTSYWKRRYAVRLLQRAWRKAKARNCVRRERAARILQTVYRNQKSKKRMQRLCDSVVQAVAFAQTRKAVDIHEQEHVSIEMELARLEELLAQRQKDRCQRDWDLRSSKETTDSSKVSSPHDRNSSFDSIGQSEKELMKYRDLIEALLCENDQLKAENRSIKEAYTTAKASLGVYTQQYSLHSCASVRLLSTHFELQKSQDEKLKRYQKQMADLREDVRNQKSLYATELNTRLNCQKTLSAVLEVAETGGMDTQSLCRIRAVAHGCVPSDTNDLEGVEMDSSAEILQTRLNRRQSEGGILNWRAKTTGKTEENRVCTKMIPKSYRSTSIGTEWNSNATRRSSITERWKKMFKRQYGAVKGVP